jgi:hypothetical protein
MGVQEDKPRGKYPKLWVIWVVLAVGSFFAIETPALLNDSGGDTLTEQIQFLGGFFPPLLVVIVVGFAGWQVSHFVGRDSRIWKWWRIRHPKQDEDEVSDEI